MAKSRGKRLRRASRKRAMRMARVNHRANHGARPRSGH